MPSSDYWRAEALRRAKKDGAISTFELESNRAFAHALMDLIKSGEIVTGDSVYPFLKIAVKEQA